MADVVSKKKRSEMMSNIRSRNTKIELMVFSHLQQRGIRFKKHYDKVLGRPDVAIPDAKLAIFVDGDFWHAKGYPKCLEKLNPFWRNKIRNNYLRDVKTRKKLVRAGWKVLRVWESDLKQNREKCLKKCELHLQQRHDSHSSFRGLPKRTKI